MRRPFRGARMTKRVSVWALQIAAFTAGIRVALSKHGKLTTRTSYFLAWGDQRGAPIQGTNETKPPDTQDDKKTNAKREGPQPTPNTDQRSGQTPNQRQTPTTIENKRNHRHAERPRPNELKHFTRAQCTCQRGEAPHSRGGFSPPIAFTAACGVDVRRTATLTAHIREI